MMLRLIAAAVTTLACAHAAASGDYEALNFANTYATDIALARFQTGELGVLRTSYKRPYLYTAWRAIALGEKGIKAVPNREGGLQNALGDGEGGWTGGIASDKILEAWQAQVDAALKQTASPGNREFKPGYLSCPFSSYRHATASLAGLAKRSDATPARLQAWVATQRQVFKFCGDDPDQKAIMFGAPKKAIPMPAELPAAEALYWRQMQQYQLGAAAFHDGQYGDSSQRFAQIGATPDHPMRDWGAYLSLRSLARQGAPEGSTPGVAMAAIAKAGAAILADPSLAALHEDMRAVIRASQATITPRERFEELSRLLDNPAADPFVDDYLGDWRVLAAALLDSENKQTRQAAAAIRKNTGFADWIETLRECVPGSSVAKNAAACAAQRAHADKQWHQALARRDRPALRVWLTASALIADTMSPELEKAALEVPASAPEYLTMRYALARHYRLSGQADKARTTSDAALASAQLRAADSTSARNLFLQERFGVASSVADAAGYLVRKAIVLRDEDSGEAAPADVLQPADDGMQWLNNSLAVSELASLASDKRLPAALRTRIAVAAWMRAGLLGKTEAALKSAAAIEKSVPALAGVMQQYRTLPEGERLNFMLVSAVRHEFSPSIREADLFAERSKDESRADMWCTFKFDNRGEAPLTTVPATDSTVSAARASDMAALRALKSAVDYVGDHVLTRAAALPNDPDLPWMLHVVVMSTRGGCHDDEHKNLSRTAFRLLHKRFKRSEWAAKTPYHY